MCPDVFRGPVAVVTTSAKVEFGVQVLPILATSGRTMTARELATTPDQPSKFLERILTDLGRGRLLVSRRGVGSWVRAGPGGLRYHPSHVIETLVGTLAGARGRRVGRGLEDASARRLHATWSAMRADLQFVLGGVTVEDIVCGDLPDTGSDGAVRVHGGCPPGLPGQTHVSSLTADGRTGFVGPCRGKECPMRKLAVVEFITLDGVMQGLAGPGPRRPTFRARSPAVRRTDGLRPVPGPRAVSSVRDGRQHPVRHLGRYEREPAPGHAEAVLRQHPLLSQIELMRMPQGSNPSILSPPELATIEQVLGREIGDKHKFEF